MTANNNFIDDEPQAFPGNLSETSLFISGMTLRDYFAAKAMSGWLASFDTNTVNIEQLATFSFAVAEAMMEARNRECE